jgi:pimeloyl-ACP methyl ester carboxylesterase
MHVGFTYFQDFDADASADATLAKTPLRMPVLAMGGQKSFAPPMPAFAKAVAVNVRTSVIPDSGHWLMDENPAATIAALSAFLAGR